MARMKEELSSLEAGMILGITFLAALVVLLLFLKPFDDGKLSVDAKNLDNAIELAKLDFLDTGGTKATYNEVSGTYTYYYAPNASSLGLKISAEPSFRGSNGRHKEQTIVVVLDDKGDQVSAGWSELAMIPIGEILVPEFS